MSDFLVIKSTEEQRAEGVESPVDTAYIDDRDGLPILKAVFDIRHFRPDDVTIAVEDTSGEESDGAQRQLVLFAQLTDDSRECSMFKKVLPTVNDILLHLFPYTSLHFTVMSFRRFVTRMKYVTISHK